MDLSDEPSWAVLLRALYRGERSKLRRSPTAEKNIVSSDEIFDRTHLNQNEADQAVEYLLDAGMLEEGHKRTDPYRLTNRGFEIAHQRAINRRQEVREDRRNKRQNEVNKAVAFFTFGLLVVGLFDMVVTGYAEIGLPDWQILLALGIGVALVVRIVWEITRRELLFENESDDSAPKSVNEVEQSSENSDNRKQPDSQRQELKKELEGS